MGYGYLLTRSRLEPPDARAVVTFRAGPWAQMVSFHEASLKSTRASVDALRGDSADLVDELIYGLPPIPVPTTPKIGVPPIDGFVAIVLARVAPGQSRAFASALDDGIVTGAVRLLTPYSHLLLDISVESEDRLLEALDEVLDRPEVVKARVGIALAEDVTYLDAPG